MQTTVVMLLKLVLQGSINRRDFLELYKETFITNKMLGYGMIAIMIVFNIVDMVAFSGFVENSKMAKLKAKMEVAQYQNEINYKYYSDIKDNAIEMHKIRHDLNNILQSIYNIIYSSGGDETGEAKRLFEGLKEKAENLKIVSYCPNELINAIVSAKKSECESLGIEFEQDIEISAEPGIEEVDLCRGICNMLDNAIEAQKSLPDSERKYVDFKIRKDNGRIYISTTNSVSPDIKVDKKKRTTKKDKKNHGFGLSIIDDIAKKYDGDFVVSQTGNVCMAVLELKVN